MIQIEPTTMIRMMPTVETNAPRRQRGPFSRPRCMKNTSWTMSWANARISTLAVRNSCVKAVWSELTWTQMSPAAASVSRTERMNPETYDLSVAFIGVLHDTHKIDDGENEYPDDVEEVPEERKAREARFHTGREA